jgi:hypothetical protein
MRIHDAPPPVLLDAQRISPRQPNQTSLLHALRHIYQVLIACVWLSRRPTPHDPTKRNIDFSTERGRREALSLWLLRRWPTGERQPFAQPAQCLHASGLQAAGTVWCFFQI